MGNAELFGLEDALSTFSTYTSYPDLSPGSETLNHISARTQLFHGPNSGAPPTQTHEPSLSFWGLPPAYSDLELHTGGQPSPDAPTAERGPGPSRQGPSPAGLRDRRLCFLRL